ncbi:hypothetical protein AN958_11281 [Leucoagaricus sp. SymC.cos]|nr:hypothetical protein AN958_11281 [Leucoagaricus sp. SymC.cos]
MGLVVIYFSVFLFAIFINKGNDTTIWHSPMRKFPWAGTCTILASAPPTPKFAQFQSNTVPIIHAPKPKHARPNGGTKRPPVFSWRSGLSHEYHIEHYHPPTTTTQQHGGPSTSRSVELPPAAAPPMIPAAPVLLPAEDTVTSDNYFASSLYPMHMQQAIFNANSELPSRPEQALTHASAGAAIQVARIPLHAALPPSPPPLGSWPRPDIISKPVTKGKRKLPPSASPRGDFSGDIEVQGIPGSPSEPSKRREHQTPTQHFTAPSSFAPLRPAGPRRRSGSTDLTNRPPALDIQKIEYA